MRKTLVSFFWALLLVLTVAIPAAFAATIQLPATGQTVCYDTSGAVVTCSNTGQDGDKLAGLAWPGPRFTDNGNSTVTDNLTGLIWMKDAGTPYVAGLQACTTGTKDWQGALAYVACLNANSYQGSAAWRLPSIKELASLGDLQNTNPALPTGHLFTNLPPTATPTYYWSATTSAAATTSAWYWDIKTGKESPNAKTALYRLLAVRSGATNGPAAVARTGQTLCYDASGAEIACTGTGQDGEKLAGVAWPSPRFTDNGNGTVTDNLTGLTWLQNANCLETVGGIAKSTGKVTWANAFIWTANLASGSCGLSDSSVAGDWRLPNQQELKSLLDYSVSNPSLPSGIFTTPQNSSYWTSSTDRSDLTRAWTVSWSSAGSVSFMFKSASYPYYVLPVRGGIVGPADQRQLGVTLSLSNSGTVTSNPGGINCSSGTCTASYALNSQITLTAAPAQGYSFTSWSDACSGTATTCTVTMDTAKETTATFTAIPTYQLSVTISGSGTVTSNPAGINCSSGTCNATYDENTDVTLTAAAAQGYSFTGWSGGGCSGTATTCTVTMDAAMATTATFTAIPTYQLAVTISGSGTVTSNPAGISCSSGTCNATYDENTDVTLTAAAAEGYSFTGWSGGACSSGTSTTCTVTMDAAKATTATFSVFIATYPLSVSVSGSGTVTSNPGSINCSSGTCSETYDENTEVTLTASPAGGYSFAGWSGACTGTATTCTVTMGAAKNVTASFGQLRPLTTASPWMGAYPAGQTVSLSCSDIAGCATTYYCLGSGCTPTTVYSGQITLNSSTVLRFYSVNNNSAAEPVRSYSYTIDPGLAYKQTRTMPQTAQPWNFSSPIGIATDSNGYIYVADTYNDRIQKFDSSGNYIASWGIAGSGNGQFVRPRGITVDVSGNIYVADTYNHRIQKFDNNGVFQSTWGSSGSGDGEFNSPSGITVDGNGNIYVADTENDRIQKFDSNGVFQSTLGSLGDGDGQFRRPRGITIDGSGTIYVADTYNHRIQKFTSSGVYQTKWGSFGINNSQFNSPHSITIDSSGTLYVADTFNNRFQAFDTNGNFIATWGSSGAGDGQVSMPSGITVNTTGTTIYLADTGNNRIQKFDSSGSFIAKWEGSKGSSAGQFHSPSDCALDSSNNLYVVDGNQRIQKFDSAGTFVSQWGSYGTDNGQFYNPKGITISSSGYIYLVDTENHRIQKFNSSGVHQSTWGSEGSDEGQFNLPKGITIDSSGYLYVVDSGNNRIQKLKSTGTYQGQWGSYGTGNGQFNNPSYITVDSSGNFYVTDTDNHRVQKFNSSGVFQSTWGSLGGANGQFYYPQGITIDSSGYLYVVDSNNYRIQKFDSNGNFITKWGTGGLDNGQLRYPVGIRTDSSGNIFVVDSENSRIQKFSLAVTAPGAPTIGSATAGNGQATVSFTPPASDGGHAIVFYRVTSNPGSISTIGSASPITITGLTNGTPYTFTVTATNGAGAGTDSAASNQVVPQLPSYSLSVTVSGNGTVETNPQGIACTSGTCSADFIGNDYVVLFAAPDPGYRFSGWGGACSGSETLCDVFMDAAKTVTATFEVIPVTYQVSVTLAGTGTGTVTSIPAGISCLSGSSTGCSSTFTSGASVSLEASAGVSSVFAGWSGACSGSSSPCSITVNSALNTTATFNLNVADNARIGSTSYGTLANAYAAAVTGNEIKAQAVVFDEGGTLTFGRDVIIKLLGGYDSGFATPGGYTTIDSQLVIGRGTVTVDRIIIR